VEAQAGKLPAFLQWAVWSTNLRDLDMSIALYDMLAGLAKGHQCSDLAYNFLARSSGEIIPGSVLPTSSSGAIAPWATIFGILDSWAVASSNARSQQTAASHSGFMSSHQAHHHAQHERLATLDNFHACLHRVSQLREWLGAAPAYGALTDEDIETLSLNTAIAQMMIFVNAFTNAEVIPVVAIRIFLILLNPFAPHISSELWQVLNGKFPASPDKITAQSWPSYDELLLVEDDEMVRHLVSRMLKSPPFLGGCVVATPRQRRVATPHSDVT